MSDSRYSFTEAPDRVYDRLIARATRDELTGCLVAGHSASKQTGYSVIGWSENGQNHTELGHRVVWMHAHGPMAEGMTVDHRQGYCPRNCVEVTHLRELPLLENSRRNKGSDWPLGQLCSRNHGPEHQVLVDRQTRTGAHRQSPRCSECMKIAAREYKAANRADVNRRNREYRARKKSGLVPSGRG